MSAVVSGNTTGKATAIVLGRAGSTGVPGKNTRELAGKPCAAWTIEHAQRSERIGRVVVSTDCPRLADIARSMSAEVVLRPSDLASDTATVDSAARHAVAGADIDGLLALLYANVPVRPEGLIDRAVRVLLETGCDSVQSYERVGKHHPWWIARVDEATGTVRPWEGGVLNHGVYRRQDLPPAYLPDGGVITLTREALMLEIDGAGDGPHAFFGNDRRGVVSEPGSVIDIDTEADLHRAEAALASRRVA
ncbi:MAG: acylneuraminate cytidylyltransferase family protein [Planctomycetota bacterium]